MDARLDSLHSTLKELRLADLSDIPGDQLDKAVSDGFVGDRSLLAAILAAVCYELSTLYELDERINHDQPTRDFLMQLGVLLSELGILGRSCKSSTGPHANPPNSGCCNPAFTTGPAESRFTEPMSRLSLLEFLTGHVKSARLFALQKMWQQAEMRMRKRKRVLNRHTASTPTVSRHSKQVQMAGEALSSTLKSLKIKDDSAACSGEKLSGLLVSATGEVLSTSNVPTKPLFTTELSKEEWKQVEDYAAKLNLEFAKRSDLLLKRLDVTVESFFWSDRVKRMETDIMAFYKPARDALRYAGDVHTEDLLAARLDLLSVDKASSRSAGLSTSNEITSFKLQDQPFDRGGRTGQMAPASTETFVQQQRRGHNGREGGGGREGRGGYRGGGGRQGGDQDRNWGKRRRDH